MAEAGTGWRIERVPAPSRAASILVPIVSVLLALVAGAILIRVAGRNPLEVYRAMLAGSLGDRNGLAETLVKTTPLLLQLSVKSRWPASVTLYSNAGLPTAS